MPKTKPVAKPDTKTVKPATKEAKKAATKKPAEKPAKQIKPAAKPSAKPSKTKAKTAKAVAKPAKGKAAPVAKKTKKSAPVKGTIPKPHKGKDPLIVLRPKNFGIGNDIQPPRNLYRYVRWPRYVRMQRQKRLLMKRLKVPPALNILNSPLRKKDARALFRLLHKYRPEEKSVQKARLLAEAKALSKTKSSAKKSVEKSEKKQKICLHSGVNHVTRLIERKKAKLVVIPNDVDPVELVVFIPYLCRKMNVPFCVIRSKARLGRLVHRKTAAVVAITEVSKGDAKQFNDFCEVVRGEYTSNTHLFRTWGGNKKPRKVVRKIKA